MKNSLRLRVLFFMVVLTIGIGAAFVLLRPEPNLPIYTPKDLNPRVVDSTLHGKSTYELPSFELINQFGDTVNQTHFKNTIRVVDFFFTTCRSICPKMTQQLKRVQDAFQPHEIQIISHSVMPQVDTPEVLLTYGEMQGANFQNWTFLTGPDSVIIQLARKRYFAVVDEPSPEGPDFIHTENLVLIDSQDQIRGFYDGTSPQETNQLIQDIQTLQYLENKIQ